MRLFEIEKHYYTLSSTKLKEGDYILPRNDDEKIWNLGWIKLLNQFRPKSIRPHHKSIFMSGSPEDAWMSGPSGVNFLYVVKPIGKVDRYDVNNIDLFMDLMKSFDPNKPDGFEIFKRRADAYWSGEEFTNGGLQKPLWEYVAKKALIIKVEPGFKNIRTVIDPGPTVTDI